jgi:hypothetical protein
MHTLTNKVIYLYFLSVISNFERSRQAKRGTCDIREEDTTAPKLVAQNGLFYQDRVEALQGVIEAKLADSSLYLSSIVLVPSSPSSFITVSVFCTICTIGSFPAHHPCIYLRVQRRNQFSMRLPCYVARFIT